MLTPQLEILIVLFIVSVVIWFALIIYEKRLERQEEDKVFLTTPERMGEEQTKILQKVMSLSKPLWIFGTLSVLFLLCALGVWIYQGLLSH
jgi:hypothetical protein